jgi:Dyp-type peroxidase family
MPIHLTKPLAWKKADPDELKLLQALQGNVLKGHGRESTADIFFRFGSAAKDSKRMLRDLANFHVVSAHRQLLDAEKFKASKKCDGGGPFVHLALSFAGYQALGLGASAPTDTDFRGGMKSSASISALADPAVTTWETPFQSDIHGMVLAADETEGKTAALAGKIKELIEAAGGTIVHVQHGRALKNARGDGIENFGYVDGRSQPLMLQEDIEAETSATGSSRWDPAFPLKLALVDDPGVTDSFSFGSFFVFRKLEQDVRGFKTREQEVADVLELTGEDRELAGAMIVGRFEDGTPVTLSDEARGEDPPNNFNYDGDAGARCPFHGHIRKSNPRGSGKAEAPAVERMHLMARRGIPYEDVKRDVHPSELPDAGTKAAFDTDVAPSLPTGGVGLLFMAYNHKIGDQFKFTQQFWVNATQFPLQPGGPHGIDPVIGQGPVNPTDQKIAKTWDDTSAGLANNVSFSGFVKMKGGEYFFSPSLTFLKNL